MISFASLQCEIIANSVKFGRSRSKREISLSIGAIRPCPHDTFPNWARSIAPSSRPVARVHTGATGTLVPDPRDHLSTWNEWARSIAIGCALSNLSCGRSSGRYRPVSKSAAVGTRLLDLLLPLLGTRALSRVFNRLRHVKADTRTQSITKQQTVFTYE